MPNYLFVIERASACDCLGQSVVVSAPDVKQAKKMFKEYRNSCIDEHVKKLAAMPHNKQESKGELRKHAIQCFPTCSVPKEIPDIFVIDDDNVRERPE